MLFCHFVQLSEILLGLLLVVVQVLRLSAPFRQSGLASFVDFVSSLALLAVMLSLFSVFWRRLLQHYFVVVYCAEDRLLHLQRHYSTCVTSWSLVRGRCSGSSSLQFTTTWSAVCVCLRTGVLECSDDASLHLDFTFVSLVSGHPRPPVVTAPVYRGCPCRDPLGCLRCPGRMTPGAERQPLWLRCVGGGGHVMWTFLIHAFYKHTSSTREVTLLTLRKAP